MPTMIQPMQSVGSGDAFALTRKEFAAEILAAFSRGSEFYNRTYRDTIVGGNSKQIDATWRGTEYSHTEGDEATGENKPQSIARSITLESTKRVSSRYLDKGKMQIMHNLPAKRSEFAKQSVEALLYKADAWIAQCIILGARQSASGDFDAGNTVSLGAGGDITLHPSDGSTIAGTSIAAAFPVSSKGSKTLQAALALLQQKMSEKFVPRVRRTVWLSPYLMRVLRQDDSLLSRDYVAGNSGNDKASASIGLVEGFEIVETNNIPSTNLSADSNTPTAYRGDFTLTVAPAIGDEMAVGTLLLGGGVEVIDDYVNDKLAWLMGAHWWKGHNWLRPEACCEIKITGS